MSSLMATTTVFVTVAPTSTSSTVSPSTAMSGAMPSSSSASTLPIVTPSATSPNDAQIFKMGSITHPLQEQIMTIYAALIMFTLILLSWNMFLLRTVLHPWKMLVNLIHEASHVFVAVLTGATIFSVTIDPDKGPISGMTGGHPLLILAAGYLGSSLVGSALIMASFDTSASKVACLCCLSPTFAISFWFGRTWASIRLFLCMGLTIGFWFIDHAFYLRFYILFIGVMSAFYVVWDAMDDVLFRKENESDAALFARMTLPTIHAWVMIWFVVSLAFASLGVIGGLHFFNESSEAQKLAQTHFLPT